MNQKLLLALGLLLLGGGAAYALTANSKTTTPLPRGNTGGSNTGTQTGNNRLRETLKTVSTYILTYMKGQIDAVLAKMKPEEKQVAQRIIANRISGNTTEQDITDLKILGMLYPEIKFIYPAWGM